MAQAYKHIQVVTTETPHIVLDLSVDEAEFLAALMYKVGGDPALSRRRHADAISAVLDALGVSYSNDDMRGVILCDV